MANRCAALQIHVVLAVGATLLVTFAAVMPLGGADIIGMSWNLTGLNLEYVAE